jgi:hypothetical protein
MGIAHWLWNNCALRIKRSGSLELGGVVKVCYCGNFPQFIDEATSCRVNQGAGKSKQRYRDLRIRGIGSIIGRGRVFLHT